MLFIMWHHIPFCEVWSLPIPHQTKDAFSLELIPVLFGNVTSIEILKCDLCTSRPCVMQVCAMRSLCWRSHAALSLSTTPVTLNILSWWVCCSETFERRQVSKLATSYFIQLSVCKPRYSNGPHIEAIALAIEFLSEQIQFFTFLYMTKYGRVNYCQSKANYRKRENKPILWPGGLSGWNLFWFSSWSKCPASTVVFRMH